MKEAAVPNPQLADVVKRLIEAYAPERIYLFGSSARGDAGFDSDYDLLLHLPTSLPATIIRESRLLHAA